jgi:hypothetical protein
MDEYLKALTTVAAAKSPDVGRVAARTAAS